MAGGGIGASGIGSSGIGTPSTAPAQSPFSGNRPDSVMTYPGPQNQLTMAPQQPVGDTFISDPNRQPISFEQIANMLRAFSQQNPQGTFGGQTNPVQNSVAPVGLEPYQSVPAQPQPQAATPVAQQPVYQRAYERIVPPSTNTWKSIRDARAELFNQQNAGGIQSLVK